MHVASVSASLRQGITMESSTGVAVAADACLRGRWATLMAGQRNARAGIPCPEKEVTPTDRLSGAGTRPCGPVPAPSNVSLGAVEKGRYRRSKAQGQKSVRRQLMTSSHRG